MPAADAFLEITDLKRRFHETRLIFCCVLLASVVPGLAETAGTRQQVEARFGGNVDAIGCVCLYRKGDDFCLVTHDRGATEHRFTLFKPKEGEWLRAPNPGFPAQTRPVAEGIGLYEFTFDAAGNIAGVNIIQSANSVLNHWSERYAKDHWKGPPDSSVTLAIAYHHSGEGARVYGR